RVKDPTHDRANRKKLGNDEFRAMLKRSSRETTVVAASRYFSRAPLANSEPEIESYKSMDDEEVNCDASRESGNTGRRRSSHADWFDLFFLRTRFYLREALRDHQLICRSSGEFLNQFNIDIEKCNN
ncbi:MAG: hypothetical protein ACXW4O_16500, partial [Candidatus Binatia bacterium]